MVKLRHATWNELLTVVSLIIFLCHFRGIYAACHPPVGHALGDEDSVLCKRLELGTELKISCSGVVHKNGILLNESSNVFGISSVADYGWYRCSSGRDGIVTYLVLPASCNVCPDKFVTVDIKPINITHINVTCVVHITGMPYCCNLRQNQTMINGGTGIIHQGLSKIPMHLTSYRCICSLKCHDANLQQPLVADVESNYTTFDPANVTNISSVSSITSTTTATATTTTTISTTISTTTTTTTTASSITNMGVYSSDISTSISPTCNCDRLDIDNQHRGSIIGEIIGSFMAGVVIATVIIMLTGAMCKWTTKRRKRSRDQTVRIKSCSTPSSPGVSIEIRKNNTVVRYHPAPINPPADDQLEPNNTTSCLDVENAYSDFEGPEGTINTVSSNIDISSAADINDGSTIVSANDVERELPQPTQNNSNTTVMAQVATPEQCTQVRNHVYHDPQQNQRRRTISHSSVTSLHN